MLRRRDADLNMNNIVFIAGKVEETSVGAVDKKIGVLRKITGYLKCRNVWSCSEDRRFKEKRRKGM